MSYSTDRSEFIARIAVLAGTPAHQAVHLARRLMRHASTLQRLALAQCNGDWPADNGTSTRPVVPCPLCGSSWVPAVISGGRLAIAAWDYERDPGGVALHMRTACPDCRTAAGVRNLCRAHLPAHQPVFSGDPRGYVVHLAPAAASREDIDAGRVSLIAIPGRE